MLVSVAANQIKMGMYVHDLNMPWWGHQFMLPRFFVNSQQLLDKLHALGSAPITVDDSMTFQDSSAEVSKEIPDLVNTSVNTESSSLGQTPVDRPRQTIKVSFEEELKIAHKIVKEAKAAVSTAMACARAGEITNIPQIEDISSSMVEVVSRNPAALLSLASLKTKDDYTFMHSVAVSTFMIAFGRKLGFSSSELEEAGTAGLLHDVGKGYIPDIVLNKPSRLTPSELALIKMHPALGHDLLRSSNFGNEVALEVVLRHHERLDGQGYPGGFKANQISQLVRMGSITDVYDAVTSNRSYHKAIAPTAALKLLMSESGNHFDPALTRTFVSTLGLYPNSSLVRLKSNKLAIVLQQTEGAPLAPMVYVIYSLSSKLPVTPYILKDTTGKDAIESFEDPLNWNFDIPRYLQELSY